MIAVFFTDLQCETFWKFFRTKLASFYLLLNLIICLKISCIDSEMSPVLCVTAVDFLKFLFLLCYFCLWWKRPQFLRKHHNWNKHTSEIAISRGSIKVGLSSPLVHMSEAHYSASCCSVFTLSSALSGNSRSARRISSLSLTQWKRWRSEASRRKRSESEHVWQGSLGIASSYIQHR